MLEQPPSPHDLIGDNWPAIDEVALASLSSTLVNAASASQAAEQKAYTDGNILQGLLVEGFEKQVEAPFRIGGMAADLAGALGKAAAETNVVAHGVLSAKVHITVTVGVAEAIIAAKEAEIAALQAVPLLPEIRAMRIQQLRNEIEQVTNEAKSDIQAMYNGIYTPAAPPPPGLSPIIHTGPGAAPGSGAASGERGVQPLSWQDEAPTGNGPPARVGDESAATEGVGSERAGEPFSSDASDQMSSAQPFADENATGAPSSMVTEAASGSHAPVTAMPSMGGSAPSAASGSAGSLSGVSSAMPKVSGVSAPTSGVSSASGLSSASGGGLSGLSGAPSVPSASTPTPTQQFMSGATQGLVSPGTAASAASASTAAAQPVRPPPGAMMPAGPPPASAATPAAPAAVGPAAGTPVVSPPAAGASVAATPAAGAVPLAPPPAAGVPNATAPAPPAPAAPAAAPATTTGGGGGGGAPPVTGIGGQDAGLKAARMGARAVSEGLRTTPEFHDALALVSALHDPAIGVACEWACAVFKQSADEEARFVVASREGLSWIPSGVYMPAGVTVAILDDAIPYATRKLWRGMKPPARVLAAYGKAIGEQPRIVVAREWLGLQGLFDRRTVLAADDEMVVDPNPVLDPSGLHRLQLASPDGWWQQVQEIPEQDIATRIRDLAAHVAQAHDEAFGVHDVDSQQFGGRALRSAAVEQVGRPGGEAVWQSVEQQMHWTRAQIMTAPIAAPEPLYEGWNNDVTAAEQMLRGWEVLWLAQRPASRATLADMTYAAAAALM